MTDGDCGLLCLSTSRRSCHPGACLRGAMFRTRNRHRKCCPATMPLAGVGRCSMRGLMRGSRRNPVGLEVGCWETPFHPDEPGGDERHGESRIGSGCEHGSAEASSGVAKSIGATTPGRTKTGSHPTPALVWTILKKGTKYCICPKIGYSDPANGGPHTPRHPVVFRSGTARRGWSWLAFEMLRQAGNGCTETPLTDGFPTF